MLTVIEKTVDMFDKSDIWAFSFLMVMFDWDANDTCIIRLEESSKRGDIRISGHGI